MSTVLLLFLSPSNWQFADPAHWLRYFPPLAMRDMKLMGCQVDWRRR